MTLTLSADLREQSTPRGRALQQADLDRIAGVLHFFAAHKRNSGAAPYLAEARRRLDAAALGYETNGLAIEWIRTAAWSAEAKRAETQVLQGTFAYQWLATDTPEVTQLQTLSVELPSGTPLTAGIDSDGELWVEMSPFRLSPMEKCDGMKSCDVRFVGCRGEMPVVSLRWLRERRTGGKWPRRLEALEEVIRTAIDESQAE